MEEFGGDWRRESIHHFNVNRVLQKLYSTELVPTLASTQQMYVLVVLIKKRLVIVFFP